MYLSHSFGQVGFHFFAVIHKSDIVSFREQLCGEMVADDGMRSAFRVDNETTFVPHIDRYSAPCVSRCLRCGDPSRIAKKYGPAGR